MSHLQLPLGVTAPLLPLETPCRGVLQLRPELLHDVRAGVVRSHLARQFLRHNDMIILRKRCIERGKLTWPHNADCNWYLQYMWLFINDWVWESGWVKTSSAAAAQCRRRAKIGGWATKSSRTCREVRECKPLQ